MRFSRRTFPIRTASQAGYPSTLARFNKNNLQPRVGFAYKPFGDKTVFRGGYGIYTNLIYATLARSHLTGGPFSGSVTYNNRLDNGVPLFSFPSPFLTSGTASVQNVNGVNPDLKTPYTQQWNFTVERQVGSIGLRTSYAGSRSVNLVYRQQPQPAATQHHAFHNGAPAESALQPDHLCRQRRYRCLPRPRDRGAEEAGTKPHLQHRLHMGQGSHRHAGFRWRRYDLRRPGHPESE